MPSGYLKETKIESESEAKSKSISMDINGKIGHGKAISYLTATTAQWRCSRKEAGGKHTLSCYANP